MKYTRLIILIGVVVLIFSGAAIAYTQLSANNSTDSQETTAIVIAASKDSSASAGSTQNTTSAADTSSAASVSAKEGTAVGNLAYDFTLTNYAGENVTLSDLRGKIVVLNFCCLLYTSPSP